MTVINESNALYQCDLCKKTFDWTDIFSWLDEDYCEACLDKVLEGKTD